jgi:succinate-semialdehyde dehydrogenase/glutarate-semialdehyde dehydrogenase
MVTAAGAEQLESFNPATGGRLGSVPITPAAGVEAVVDAVAKVQPFWAELTLSDRARYLERTAQVLIDETDEIRDLIVREQGKPRNEAFSMELLPTIDSLRWIARAGQELLADEKIPMPQLYFKTKRSSFMYEPLGVIGVIAPWNYPWSIPFSEVAMALMAGNGVVLKPASLTPLIGERIVHAFERAGVPEGLVRAVHGPGTGAALVQSSITKVFFTGSVQNGRWVGEASGRALKGSVLELGGKDPMLVLADAHVEHAVAGCLWGGFANAGQTCSGIERVYVMRHVSERFIAGVVAGARRLRIGDPMAWETEIGPMASREQFDLVRELVDDAVAAGAELRCGGPRAGAARFDRGHFYAPAVLTGVTHEMRIMREEIFGPVVPIVVVDSEDEAVALANDSEFGLGASVWTSDRARAERIAGELQAGMVWINDHLPGPVLGPAPWGAVKGGSHGRSYGPEGMRACVEPKVISWAPPSWRGPFWHPYDDTTSTAARTIAQLRSARDSDREQALRHGLGALARLAARSLRGSDPRR